MRPQGTVAGIESGADEATGTDGRRFESMSPAGMSRAVPPPRMCHLNDDSCCLLATLYVRLGNSFAPSPAAASAARFSKMQQTQGQNVSAPLRVQTTIRTDRSRNSICETVTG